MALPVITDVIRFTLTRDDGAGKTASNVMHFLSPGYSIGSLSASLETNVDRAMWDPIWEGYGAITFEFLPLDGTSATTTATPATPSDWTGEGSGELIPQSAVIVKLQTGLRGRSHRGRLYLGGIGEDRQNGGSIPSATVAEMQTKWDGFTDAMATDGFPMLVASYKLGTATQVQDLVVEALAGTQRRRMSQLRH